MFFTCDSVLYGYSMTSTFAPRPATPCSTASQAGAEHRPQRRAAIGVRPMAGAPLHQHNRAGQALSLLTSPARFDHGHQLLRIGRLSKTVRGRFLLLRHDRGFGGPQGPSHHQTNQRARDESEPDSAACGLCGAAAFTCRIGITSESSSLAPNLPPAASAAPGRAASLAIPAVRRCRSSSWRAVRSFVHDSNHEIRTGFCHLRSFPAPPCHRC